MESNWNFGNAGFEERENRNTRRKTSREARTRTDQQQILPTHKQRESGKRRFVVYMKGNFRARALSHVSRVLARTSRSPVTCRLLL